MVGRQLLRGIRREGEAPVSVTSERPVTAAVEPSTIRVAGWKRRERLIGTAMMAPQAIPFILFTLVPVGWAVYISFTDYNGFASPSWVGLDNYQAMVGDNDWWRAARTTFIFAAAKMIIEIPVSLGLALLLNRKIRLAGFFRTIFFIPHVVSIAVMGVVFYFLLRPEAGVINGLLQSIGVLDQPYDWLGHPISALGSLVMVGVWAGFGINTVLFLVGLQTVPKDLYESARTDGASAIQQFRYITLPMIRPMMQIIVILTIIATLRSFDIVKTLTDGGPAGTTEVMFTYLFSYYFSADNPAQFGYASALSVTAAVMIAIVSVLYLFASRQRDQPAGHHDD